MKKYMTITYEVEDNLYLNITNACPCDCVFCIRNNADGAYGSEHISDIKNAAETILREGWAGSAVPSSIL